jgi:hypothetical protein
MRSTLPRTIALATLVAAAGQAGATITLFGHDDFRGPRVTLTQAAHVFREFDFNDRASSVVVEGESWEVCQDIDFRSRCAVLVPGSYPNLGAVGLGDLLSSARPMRRQPPPPPPPPPVAAPQDGDVVFFEYPGFQGRGVGLSSEIDDMHEVGFNDRASSMIVFEGRWEVCEHADFGGRCMILRPGRYPDLGAMGMNGRIATPRRRCRSTTGAAVRRSTSRRCRSSPCTSSTPRRRGSSSAGWSSRPRPRTHVRAARWWAA